jgi:DNA-binding MarR family transcriptional regulator
MDEHNSYQCARAWVALRDVHSRISEVLAEALARECGLTINDFEVLVHLQAAGDQNVRLSDLADVVPLSQPALSRLVMRLEQQELVTRAESTTDRRAVLLALTEKGLDTLRRATPIHADCIREHLTSRLTEAEQELLITAFARIQAE